MTVTVDELPAADQTSLSANGQRLSLPIRLGLLAGTVLGSLLLFAVTPLQGRADFLVFVVLAYAVVQTTASFLLEGRRYAVDRLLSLAVHLSLLAALIPLVAVLAYTVVKGLKRLDGSFLTHNLTGIGPLDVTGGEYHAIIGTLEQVLIAIVIAVPLGLLVAIYITEYGRGWLASSSGSSSTS